MPLKGLQAALSYTPCKDLHRGGPLYSHFISEDETHAAKDPMEGNHYRHCCRVPGLLLLEGQGDSSCCERLVVSSPGKHLETVAAVWGREGKLVCADVISHLALGDSVQKSGQGAKARRRKREVQEFPRTPLTS